MNEHLLTQCQHLAETRRHPIQKTLSIEEVFQAEQPDLRPIVEPLNWYKEHQVRINSMCLAQYDCNQYSVACEYANQMATMRVYPRQIEVFVNGELIGEHQRCFGKEARIFNPLHYLPVLEKKPGALRNGTPFKTWKLPPALMKVKEKMLKCTKGDRHFVSILQAIKTDGLETVEVACDLALKDHMVNKDVILNAIHRLRQTKQPEPIETPITLKLKTEPLAACDRYDALLQEVK